VLGSSAYAWLEVRFALDSYNRPYLCQKASWEENGTTLEMDSSSDLSPHSIFINEDDRIHVADHVNGRLVVWNKDNIKSARTLHANVSAYSDLFVDLNGDIYFENSEEKGQINTVSVTNFSGRCFGLFIDRNNFLYCSQRDDHKVMKISLAGNNRTEINVAGNGSNGSATNQLHYPWGIFVDRQFNLFVADAGNQRIQQFQAEKTEGKTVAEERTLSGLSLFFPTDVLPTEKNRR
jgi:sugar lactone lactonase YvrE